MTPDAIQLLRTHWNDVPEADDATVRHAYEYAIRMERPRGRRLASSRPRLAAVGFAAALLLVGAGFGVEATSFNWIGKSQAVDNDSCEGSSEGNSCQLHFDIRVV